MPQSLRSYTKKGCLLKTVYKYCIKLGQTCEMASVYLNRPVCGANGYKKNRNVSGILFVRNLTGECSAQRDKTEWLRMKSLTNERSE